MFMRIIFLALKSIRTNMRGFGDAAPCSIIVLTKATYTYRCYYSSTIRMRRYVPKSQVLMTCVKAPKKRNTHVLGCHRTLWCGRIVDRVTPIHLRSVYGRLYACHQYLRLGYPIHELRNAGLLFIIQCSFYHHFYQRIEKKNVHRNNSKIMAMPSHSHAFESIHQLLPQTFQLTQLIRRKLDNSNAESV